ncbi:hypothetical protein MIR68_008886 [Amoeboaphelidium protococcarum]|nr:hypothetical protein MIR68_008886 [Amoeboaphelidium protococcarum]
MSDGQYRTNVRHGNAHWLNFQSEELRLALKSVRAEQSILVAPQFQPPNPEDPDDESMEQYRCKFGKQKKSSHWQEDGLDLNGKMEKFLNHQQSSVDEFLSTVSEQFLPQSTGDPQKQKSSSSQQQQQTARYSRNSRASVDSSIVSPQDFDIQLDL